MISVPDLVGLSRSVAESTIETRGLTVGNITTTYSSLIIQGSVISQDPIAGADVASGTAVHLVISDGPDPNPGTVDSKFDLWTMGTSLRGVNIYQRKVYVELDGSDFLGAGYIGPPYSQSDFNDLAAMGCNYVNISHPGLYTEVSPYNPDLQVQSNLDNLLDMIESADMFAVISFRTGPGRSEFTFFWGEDDDWFDASYYNDTVWTNQAAQDAWVQMWSYTADRYKDREVIVGYDLMVEPNSNEVWLDEWDPEIFETNYADTLYDWNQLHPEIVEAIREVDWYTPVLVGGNGYSGADWLPWVKVENLPRVVYTVHQYEPNVYTHQEPSDTGYTYPGVFDTDWDSIDDQFNQAWLTSRMGTIDLFIAAHQVPLAVNEFGVVRYAPGAAEFMDDQISLFEQRGINYAYWAWNPSWESYAEEVDAMDIMHGPNPTNHENVTSSDLITVMKTAWTRNTIRPSTVDF